MTDPITTGKTGPDSENDMLKPAGEVKSFPNLFVVGAPKCGTTSLADALGLHPDIFVPPNKEPFFLADDFDHRDRIGDAATYAALYEQTAQKRYALDGSTFYLYSRSAAGAIHQRCPNARILILVRDPVAQIASMFQHNVRRGHEDQTDLTKALALQADRAQGRNLPSTAKSPDLLQYEAIANYAPQIARYYDLFPPQQIHIEFFDDFTGDMPAALTRILEFLDLDPNALPAEDAIQESNVTATERRARNHSLDRMIGKKTGLLGAVKSFLPSGTKAWIRKSIQTLNTAGTGAGDVTLLNPDGKLALAKRLEPGILELEKLTGRDLSTWRGQLQTASVGNPDHLPLPNGPGNARPQQVQGTDKSLQL